MDEPPGAHEAGAATTLDIRGNASHHDALGNTYGILDVGPDPADPAILLGVREAASGERFGHPLRTGDRLDVPGTDLVVTEIKTSPVPRIVLVGTVEPAPEPA